MSKTIETRASLKEYETKTRAALRGVSLTAGISEETYLTLTFATAHGEARIDVSAHVPLGFLPAPNEDGARYEIAIRKLRAAPRKRSKR